MKIAVIDDEVIAGQMVKRILDQEGFEVELFQTGTSFLAAMQQTPFDIAFIDLKLPDMEGLSVLNKVKQINEATQAIIITGYGSVDTALKATEKGAFYYINKPCRRNDIRLLASRAREKIELQEENRKLKLAMNKDNMMVGFIGASPAMQEIFAMIKKLAMVKL